MYLALGRLGTEAEARPWAGPLFWAALGVLLSLLLASSAWLVVSDLSKYSTMYMLYLLYMLYMLDGPQGRCAGQPWGSSSPCSSPPRHGSSLLISVSSVQYMLYCSSKWWLKDSWDSPEKPAEILRLASAC